MNQNQNAVLMCFNIPRGIKEENLYELFSVAGPIESIQFGKSGKSVFIIYEFREAIATAKEVFKDVKLYGRPIRMFDKGDIEKIHAKQEDELNVKQHETNYGYNGPPANFRRHEEFAGHSHDNQNYHSSEAPRYQNDYSREFNYQRYPRFHAENPRPRQTHPRNIDYSQDSESNVGHSEQSASKNNFSHRPDLSNNQKQTALSNSFSNSYNRMPYNPQNRRDDSRGADNTFTPYGNFRNPYDEQVSRYNHRNSHRYEDYRNRKHNNKPYDRPNQRDRHQSRSPPPSHSSKNFYRNPQRSRNFR